MKAKHFLVVGASTDPSKFGYKVLKFYLTHQLSVTPIHPSQPSILNQRAYSSLSDFFKNSGISTDIKNGVDVGISIVTPPKVTLGVLKECKELKMNKIWCQPGSTDDACHKLLGELKSADQSGNGAHLWDGPCILRDTRHLL